MRGTSIELMVGTALGDEGCAAGDHVRRAHSNRRDRRPGADKQQVGQVAAEIRKIRPPEPYKGKGIRYQGEYVRRPARA